MKKKLMVLGLVFFLAVPGGAEIIKIPVASPFTGPLASFGEGVKNGALLKAEEINAGGGINGQKVEIELADELCDPKEAAAVATRFANDQKSAIIIGHLCSSATLAALPIYLEAKLPAITPASTNPVIGKSSPYYFRNVYRDDFQGDFLARYASQVMNFKRVAIFYEVNDYAMGLKDAFFAQARNSGLKVVGAEAYRAETTDFKAQLAKFKLLRPDAIFIPGYAPQATLLISQARNLGLKCAFFGGDGLDDEIMLKNPEAEGLFVTTPFLADRGGSIVKEFVERYRHKFSVEPNWFAANTYDAVGLAAAALAVAGNDREQVRGYLAAINSPEKAYPGVTGATYFDENGDCLKAAFVKIIRNGQWVSAEGQLQ
ncbi:MAG TPA: branched-chain amino acid ABC transporter substrate-binding protein [Proteobacteria bacterium]|nr:branched-chain amino acid ABC transporter substrate-binding protein [Pseudomonadota bacterium]